jgi:response regulator of citrate/malate metabolism
MIALVDLVRWYSNRSDLLNDLAHTARNLRQCLADPVAVLSVKSDSEPKSRSKVRDRLTEADIRSIIERYQAGTIARELAAEYEMSPTTLKKILRENQALRRDMRAEYGDPSPIPFRS